MGEGGAVYIKDDNLMEQAEIIREKGTNRKQFLLGQIDKYSWYKVGSSFLPSDVLSAILYGQLKRFNELLKHRLELWQQYYQNLQPYETAKKLRLPHIPNYAKHNGHIFFILLKNTEARNALLSYLKEHGINATFHYLPLHDAPLGLEYGYKTGNLPITEQYASCLLRLPLHHNMTKRDINNVCNVIKNFFENPK